MCTVYQVATEITELNHSTLFISNETGSVMWRATREFKNQYCKLEKSYWETNYNVTTELCNVVPKSTLHIHIAPYSCLIDREITPNSGSTAVWQLSNSWNGEL